MEVQQAHALVDAGFAEALDDGQQLCGGQAELGLLAASVCPLARGQRREAHAQAHLRHQLELGGLLDHQADLGHLLDDDEDVVPELLAHQRQADELAVLVAVADDGAALGCQRQHRHQLRLGAGLETDGDVLRGDDVLDHRLLLVDLDRVQRGVAALVFEALDVGVEGAGQPPHAVLQDVRKAHQQRQRQSGLAQLLDQPVELDGLALGAVRAHLHPAVVVDREIARAPVANAVDAAAVRRGPLATVVFACASYRHAAP